jgi:uncharacterized protein (DUF169 family)
VDVSEQVDEQKTNEWYSARLKETLGLDGSPVAVAIMSQSPRYLKEWRRKGTICIMIQSARRGASFYSSGYGIICAGGEHIGIGRSPVTDIEKALVERESLVASEHAAKRRLEQVRQRVPGRVGYIVFTPLGKAQFRPDVVLFVGKPVQISRILHLDAFETGEIDTVHGEPLCSGVIATPITTGKIGISFLDMTCRAFGKYRAEEMVVGVPYQRMEPVVRSIDRSSSGNARPDFLTGILGRIPSDKR